MIKQPTLGQKIRQERERLGLSQERFAVRADISSAALSDIENGKATPHTNTLKSICQTHNLKPETFED